MSLVLVSVAGIGIVGGLIGVPAGYALHGLVLPVMGHASGTILPPSVLDVYGPVQLGLTGIVIAMLGTLVPASWAAKASTTTALRLE